MNEASKPRIRSWFWWLAFGGLAGLVCGAFLTGFAIFLIKLDREERPTSTSADAVIALTGGADRIADAVGLLADGRARRLLVTGVNPTTSGREIGRFTPRFAEFLDCCIDLGYQAVNTAGNAEEARAWLDNHGYNSAIIVTAAYHMPRALAEMAQAAPHVKLIPHSVIPERLKSGSWWADTQLLRIMSIEYIKYLRTITAQRMSHRHATGGPA